MGYVILSIHLSPYVTDPVVKQKVRIRMIGKQRAYGAGDDDGGDAERDEEGYGAKLQKVHGHDGNETGDVNGLQIW